MHLAQSTPDTVAAAASSGGAQQEGYFSQRTACSPDSHVQLPVTSLSLRDTALVVAHPCKHDCTTGRRYDQSPVARALMSALWLQNKATRRLHVCGNLLTANMPLTMNSNDKAHSPGTSISLCHMSSPPIAQVWACGPGHAMSLACRIGTRKLQKRGRM